MINENNESRENEKKNGVSRKTLYIAATVTILAAVGLAFALGAFEGISDPAETPGNTEIVATVDGETISRVEFEQALEQEKMQYQMQGIDLDSDEMSEMLSELENQVLNNYFVIPILLENKAKAAGITVDEDEIEDRYQDYVAQFGGEEQLQEQMAAVDLTRDDLEQDINRELTITKYIDQYLEDYYEENPDEIVDEESIDLSDEQVEEQFQQLLNHYNNLKEMLEEDDPDMPREQLEAQLMQIEEAYGEMLEEDNYDAIKPIIREEILERRIAQERQAKEQQILNDHFEELREESDIEINF